MDEFKNAGRRVLDKVWEAVPWALGALVGVAFSGWITIRDHDHELRELSDDVEQIAECAQEGQCAYIKSTIDSTNERLKVIEVKVNEHHQRTAPSWWKRVERLESLRTDPRARPDAFTGSDGDKLRKRIEDLESKQ